MLLWAQLHHREGQRFFCVFWPWARGVAGAELEQCSTPTIAAPSAKVPWQRSGTYKTPLLRC